MSPRDNQHNQLHNHYLGLGMGIGMAIFTPAVIVLCVITRNFGLIGVGPALGISFGIALGQQLYRRRTNKQ